MAGGRDMEAMAGEYVLGTLDAAERAAVSERLRRDHELAGAIVAWERRLIPMVLEVKPVAPVPGLLGKINKRIDTLSAPDAEQANVLQLDRSRRRWRRTAVAMTAVAAALAVIIGVRETMWQQRPTTFVAVLQKDAMSPAFVLSLDTRTRMLTVRPVDAKGSPGKSFELWLVDARLKAPRSLGLLSDKGPMTSASLRKYDKSVYMNATYAVSIEPQGGSRTGAPTGPVVFAGKLLPGAL